MNPRYSKALKPFLVTSGVLLALLAGDTYVNRPRVISAPPYADSLAGVITRLFPERHVDSSRVARITWWHSPRSFLRTTPLEDYSYRGITTRYGDLALIAAEADTSAFSITFASATMDVELTKHEMTHLLLPQLGHPATVFQRVEQYRGR